MSIPLDWLVLIFFILLAMVFFIVYEINSKFKWRMRAHALEEEMNNLITKLDASTTLTDQINETLFEIKDKLTERQFEIFIYAIKGLPSKEIGEILSLTPATVDSHIKEILKNLNVPKRAQLSTYLFEILSKKTGIEFLPNK